MFSPGTSVAPTSPRSGRVRKAASKNQNHLFDASGNLIVRDRSNRSRRTTSSVQVESPEPRVATGVSPLSKKTRGGQSAVAVKSLYFGTAQTDEPMADGVRDPDAGVQEDVDAVDLGSSARENIGDTGQTDIGYQEEENNLPDIAIRSESSTYTDCLRRYDHQCRNGECSCGVLCSLRAPELQRMCIEREFEVKWRGDDGKGAVRIRPKMQILLQMCCKCQTIEEVDEGKKSGGYRDGIHPRFWYPSENAESLSIMSAFHFAMRGDIESLKALDLERVANGMGRIHDDVCNDLDSYRAHLARAFSTNWKFYVIKGKVNRPDVGQRQVIYLIDQVSNFVHAMNATFDHYHGHHNRNTCGRLRKGQVCNPFKLLSSCSVQVMTTLHSKVQLVLRFILQNPGTLTIETPFPNQLALRQHFSLPHAV